MPDMGRAIASAKIATHDTNGRVEPGKLPKDKARRYTRAKSIGDDDRPIDRTASLRMHRANRVQTIATTIGAIKARLIDVCEIPNDTSSVDVYLDDIDGESGSSPARLNRTGRDFQSVTGGKRENAIAANRKIGKPVLKEPAFFIDRAMVRSGKVTTLRGETVYVLRSVSKLKPVSVAETIERKQVSLKRAVSRKTNPIPLKDINGISRLYDEILKDCKISIDARSRRVVIDVIDDWLYYAYLTVTPVANYAWQSIQYPDVAAYHNRLDGRTVGDRAIDLDHSETQKTVNRKGFSYPSKFAAYEIVNTGTIVYARNDNHTVTLCELKQSSIGHKLTIDRQLYASDGKKATIAVGVNFWGDLHKIVNGMYRTIANSDRRDSVKNTKRIKTIVQTLSFFPECATLTAPQKTGLAARIYDHETGSGRLWLDKERPENGLLGVCQKVKNGDRLAIAYLRNTISLVK